MNTLGSAVGRITLAGESAARHRGLQFVMGQVAWARLPEAVRVRFAEPPAAVDYVGEFDVVRASRFGRLVALVCLLLGTPVVVLAPHGNGLFSPRMALAPTTSTN